MNLRLTTAIDARFYQEREKMTAGPEHAKDHASSQLSKRIDGHEAPVVQGWIRGIRRVPLRLRLLLLTLAVIGATGETLTADDHAQSPEVDGDVPLLLMMTERDVRHPAR
jgi:hypothetical protein